MGKRFIQTPHQRRYMNDKHMKRLSYQGEKIKITTYPLKWVTSKRPAVPIVGKVVEKLELVNIAGGM